jgi:hypothetical protein
MRTLIATAAASLLCLAASPALAQSISDADANTMLEGLTTATSDMCTDSDKAKTRPPIDQYNACQTALNELAQTRRKNSKATPGQNEVYDFYLSALEMGNTYAMLRVDQKPTERVCRNIEKQWVLANKANKANVGPEMAGALESTKEAVRPLVSLCREQYPALAGSIPA